MAECRVNEMSFRMISNLSGDKASVLLKISFHGQIDFPHALLEPEYSMLKARKLRLDELQMNANMKLVTLSQHRD